MPSIGKSSGLIKDIVRSETPEIKPYIPDTGVALTIDSLTGPNPTPPREGNERTIAENARR